MSFHEVSMPHLIAFGAVGGAEFSTGVIEFFNGEEVRIQNRENSLASWDVAHGVRKPAEMDALVRFFRERRGKANGFRFKDFTDYKLTDEQVCQNSVDLTFVGDASTTVFFVGQTYDQDAVNTEFRRTNKLVTSPADVPEVIYLDSVSQGAGFTMDRNNGTITFDVAPGAGVVVAYEGEFDVPVRFETDKMNISLDDFNAQSWSGIPIKEIIPPVAV